MPARWNESEPAMDVDLEDWGRRIQQEAVPERLQVLAAQLHKALSNRKAAPGKRLDS
jgi:hypothetical protein